MQSEVTVFSETSTVLFYNKDEYTLESMAWGKLIKCINCGLRWGTREGEASWIGNIADSACTRE